MWRVGSAVRVNTSEGSVPEEHMSEQDWMTAWRRRLREDDTAVYHGPMEDPRGVHRWRHTVAALLLGILFGVAICAWFAWRGWEDTQTVIRLLEGR